MRYSAYYLGGKVIAILLGTYYYRFFSISYRLALYVTFAAFFFEAAGTYMVAELHRHNVWIFNFYIPCELWLTGMAAYYLVENPKTRKLFFVSMLVCTLIWIINLISNGLFVYANIAMVFTLSLLTVMYIVVLYQSSLFQGNLFTKPVFWLSVSVILYTACDIPCMGLNNYLSEHMPVVAARVFTATNNLLDIIRFPLCAVSFVLLGRQGQLRLKSEQHARR